MIARKQLRRAVDQLLAGAAAAQNAYADLLSECLRLGDAEQARKLESHMHLHSVGSFSTFLHNRLLYVYDWCRRISDARCLFDEVPRRDAISYNAMLSTLSKAESLDEARSLFACIPFPDSVSYNTLISSLVKHGCAPRGCDVWSRCGWSGIGPRSTLLWRFSMLVHS